MIAIERLAIVSIVALSGAALAQSSVVTPGQWEVAVTIKSMDMPGMPAGIAKMMVGRTTRVKQCLTPADAARGPQDLLKASKGCSFTRYSMVGGRLSSEIVCKMGGGTTTATSTGSFTGTSFTAEGRSVTTGGPGGTVVMTSSTVGRRIGDCK